MAHVIWKDGNTLRRAALPVGVTTLDAQPVIAAAPHIIVADDVAASSVPVGRLRLDWQTQTVSVLPEPPRVVTIDDVIAERTRRLALGFDFDFGAGRGVHHIGTTDADMVGWDEVTKVAQALMALGQTTAPLAIETDTAPVVITPIEWMQVLVAAAAFRQPIWLGSFALQAMKPIPADYTADAYWQPPA